MLERRRRRNHELDREDLVALQSFDVLYEAGDPRKYAYYVDAGALVLSWYDPDTGELRTRTASAGEYVGLGTFETYSVSAHAAVPATVTPFPVTEIAERSATNPELDDAQASEIGREFSQRRIGAFQSYARSDADTRIAALLLALCAVQGRDGGEPRFSVNELATEFLLAPIGIDARALKSRLEEFARRGLLRFVEDDEIVLTDLASLESMTGSVAA